MALFREAWSSEPSNNQDSNLILPGSLEPYSRLLDAVLAITSDHTWLIDCAGRFLYMGPSMAKALGRDRGEMLGKTHRELDFPAEYIERLQSEREQVFSTGQPISGAAEYITVDGLRRFEYTLSPWHEPDSDLEAVLCTERDVTELWLARKAQQESEHRLQQFTKNMKAIAEETHILMAGARCILWYAEIEQAAPGSTELAWTIHHPDYEAAQRFLPLDLRDGEPYHFAHHRNRLEPYRTECDLRAKAALYAGKGYSQEFPVRASDGSIRWLHEAVTVETIIPGRHWKAVAVQVDISERKEAEALARESEARFRATFEQAAVGIALVGMDGEWLRFNQKLCDILGYMPDELLKLSYNAVRHPDEVEDGWRRVQPLLNGEIATYTVERRYIRKDGSVIWANKTISVVRDAANNPSYYICVIEDITERKNQETAIALLNRDLQHRVQEFETLVDTLPVAVYHSADPECKTMRGNALAREMLGNPPGSSLSRSALELERPEWFRVMRNGQEIPVEEMPLQLAAHTGQPVRDAELDIVWNDGATVSLYGNASPLFDEQGAVRGSIGGFVNISERKHYEHELQTANRRLKRAMQETHHRVKNNLQLIAALLELATDEHAGSLPVGDARRLLHQILMLSGIHDILTNTAGTIQAQTDRLSARAVLERLLSLLKATAEHLHFDFDVSEAPLTIHQATALSLIANELVNNAIKHGSSTLRVALTRNADEATLIVEDDGPGFPAQFDAQTSANTGLTLVQTLTRHDLQGDVVFGNCAERGARVIVNFAILAA